MLELVIQNEKMEPVLQLIKAIAQAFRVNKPSEKVKALADQFLEQYSNEIKEKIKE